MTVEEDKMTISVMKASAEKLLQSAVRTKLLEWASGMGFWNGLLIRVLLLSIVQIQATLILTFVVDYLESISDNY